MKRLASLDFFLKSPLDPDRSLYNILDNPTHPGHESVISDLKSINQSELEIYCETNSIDFHIRVHQDKDFERRRWFLANQLRRQIAQERKQYLLNTSNLRPIPYEKEGLQDLEIDKNNLVDLRNFDISNLSLSTNQYAYQICPSLFQSNSSYWISELLIALARRQNKKVMVRIDPLMQAEKASYQQMNYKMSVYGSKLDWERLKTIKSDEFGQWIDERQNYHIGVTDYVWHPNGNELHFTCEELPTDNYMEIRGSRYFHAIFNRKTGIVDHCDGAIRFFDEDELAFRRKFHVRAPEVRKIGKRVKIFQVDNNIDQQTFMNLATTFLVWNDDATHYFS